MSLSFVKNIHCSALFALVDNHNLDVSNLSNSTFVQWYIILLSFSNHLINSSALLYFLASVAKSSTLLTLGVLGLNDLLSFVI